MRVKIYQINGERDQNRVKFESLSSLERLQGSNGIDSSLYDEVFNAEIDRSNPEGHPLFRGHSLSVSDVVVTDSGAFFCDNVGFKQIEFDESKTRKPDNLMRVVYVEPGRPAYEAEVANTLEAEQKAVGGLIECVYNGDDTAIVCNDEAKLVGMEGNRRLDNGYSIIAGPFFVCGLTEDDFRSLTDVEAAKYLERFAEPEEISQKDVEADMGFTFYTF